MQSRLRLSFVCGGFVVVMVVSLSPLGRLQVGVRVVAEHGTRFLREVVATVRRFKN